MGGGRRHCATVSVGRECRHSHFSVIGVSVLTWAVMINYKQLLWSLQLILAVVFLGKKRLSFAFDK